MNGPFYHRAVENNAKEDNEQLDEDELHDKHNAEVKASSRDQPASERPDHK